MSDCVDSELVAAGRVTVVEFTAAPGPLLDALAGRLADPTIERFLGVSAAASLAARVAADRSGESAHVVLVVDGEPAGWAGWLVYPPDRHKLETTTNLPRR